MLDTTPFGKRLMAFAAADDGAVTVDWIVLTAAIVLLGMGAAMFINSSVPEIADSTSNYMQQVDVGASPF